MSAAQQEVNAYVRYAFQQRYQLGACLLGRGQGHRDFSPICRGPNGVTPRLMVWGDSHAAALASGLRKLRPDTAQFTTNSCPPFVDTDIPWRPNCKEINEFVLQEAGRIKPDGIMLDANWRFYEGEDVPGSIAKTVDGIRRVSPGSKIYLIGILPQWAHALPEIMLLQDIKLDKEQYIETPLLTSLTRWDNVLASVAKSHELKFLSSIAELCQGLACMAVVKFEDRFQPCAWDAGHLTEACAVYLSRKFLAHVERDGR